MLINDYKFHVDPKDGHIESSMSCKITEDNYQELIFYYYSPIWDNYKNGFYGSNLAGKLVNSNWNVETGISGFYCGFFPDHHSQWCCSVYGFGTVHEYSNFLKPPEFAEEVEEIRNRMW